MTPEIQSQKSRALCERAPVIPVLVVPDAARAEGLATALVAGGLLPAAWGWGALTSTAWGQLPAIVWITIFYVAIFASAFSTLLVQYAAMRLPAAKVMAYTYLTPIWVILSEAVLGQGLPGPVLLPGILATLAALALLLKTDEPATGPVRAN